MDITVTKRARQSKGERKRRLRQGYVPGAVYGRGLEPVLVEVPAKAITDVLLAETGMNTIIQLKVSGDARAHTVLVDNLERDPITRGFLNVGFHQIKKGDKVTAHVPIQLIGTPADVATNDALLEQTMEAIEVHAQPTDLPPHIDVDVSQMKVGDVLRVADLPHDPKVEFTAAEDAAIAAVRFSRTAQAVEEAEEESVSEALATNEPLAESTEAAPEGQGS